jgi:hypothetical protein
MYQLTSLLTVLFIISLFFTVEKIALDDLRSKIQRQSNAQFVFEKNKTLDFYQKNKNSSNRKTLRLVLAKMQYLQWLAGRAGQDNLGEDYSNICKVLYKRLRGRLF